MRIAISGTACQGKSTLIEDFIKEWPTYQKEKSDYRKIIAENNYPHSKQCNKAGQWAILNCKIDEIQKYSKKDKVIFDRTPLDAIVYSLWSVDKKASDIDDEFINKCIPLVRESIKGLDIIFFTPITKVAPVPIVSDGMREIDEEYIVEIDNIFKAIIHTHHIKPGGTPFLPGHDCPAIIEVFGSREERIQIIKQYLDADGDLIGDNSSVVTSQNTDMLDLLNQMKTDVESDKKTRELYRKFKL